MKNLYIFLLLVLFCNFKSQNKTIKLIVLIDNRVVSNLRNAKLDFEIINKKIKIIPSTNNLANFEIKQEEYDNLLSDASKNIVLQFDNYNYENSSTNSIEYSIELEKKFITQEYLIVYIFNLDKKEFRKKYKKLNGKNYTFEIDAGYISLKRPVR